MAYYAKLDANNVVTQVIVADQDFINTLPGTYVETALDGSFRKNYAGIGYLYDSQRDAFIEPKPYPSWSLNETTCRWEPPIPRPQDQNLYNWDEPSLSWKAI